MNSEHKFALTSGEVKLLNGLIAQDVTHARCIGASVQEAVAEPGVLCQAVVLETGAGQLIVKPTCQDFGDLEVFWLSVLKADAAEFVRDYAKQRTVNLKGNAPGRVASWKTISSLATFERKGGQSLTAHTDRGLLFDFDGQRQLLLTISGLPFFMHCFSDAAEIAAELAALLQRK